MAHVARFLALSIDVFRNNFKISEPKYFQSYAECSYKLTGNVHFPGFRRGVQINGTPLFYHHWKFLGFSLAQ